MYYIKDIGQNQINEFFFSDLHLSYLGLSDEEVHFMYSKGEYYMNPNSTYKGLFNENNELLVVIKWELFTTHCINLHCYIASKLHHQNFSSKLSLTLKKWLEDNTDFMKVLFMVPDSCSHVHNIMDKLSFIKEGHITNCYKWRQENVGVVIYGLDLNQGDK